MMDSKSVKSKMNIFESQILLKFKRTYINQRLNS